LSVSQEELSKEFFGTTLPARLEKFDALLKGPFFLGDKVRYKIVPGGFSLKNWVGVCGPLPKTLTLFMTKICDFPYPIYDLTLRSLGEGLLLLAG